MRAVLESLTTRGRAFLAAGTTCVLCAILLGQDDLLRAGILVLMLPAATLLFVGRARYRLSCSRSLLPVRAPVGQPARVTLTLKNTGRLPSSLLMLEDQVPYVLGTRPRFVIDQIGPRWKREIEYSLRSDVRGRFTIGPLTVRVCDPFGLIEIHRAFSARNSLTVTPQVQPLPEGQLHGEWSGTGDNRPRAFAAAGTEDVLIREYRHGDDLRRVHWRSSAKVGELMVRREEQPWQTRATLLIDTRASAHQGSGPASSFEWLVTATASVGVHLSKLGYALRLVSESGDDHAGHWHDRGSGAVGDTNDLLDHLAVIGPSRRARLELPRDRDEGGGVFVALIGVLTPDDVEALRRHAQGSDAGYALIADPSAWTRDGSPGREEIHEQVLRTAGELRANGWRVATAGPQHRVGTVWAELLRPMRSGPDAGTATPGTATPGTGSRTVEEPVP
ncbi:MAG: DUF58 domain-containing protein [Nocardioidaceae bacterium]